MEQKEINEIMSGMDDVYRREDDLEAQRIEKLIKEVMENYPEAGRGSSLNCTGWDYNKVEFSFYDIETEKEYEVNHESLKKGLIVFLKVIEDGKYFNNGTVPNLLSKGYTWDAQDCDALVQCTIFGEVIYG